MNISQFLRELPIIPDVEVVIPLLPEVLGTADQSARNPLLQRLDRIGEHVPLRLAEQQMHMFRHDHVAIDAEPEAASHALQGQFKSSFSAGLIQQPKAMITREGDEMALPRLLKALESPGHTCRL